MNEEDIKQARMEFFQGLVCDFHEVRVEIDSKRHKGKGVVVRRDDCPPTDQAHPTAAGSDGGAGRKESNGK